MADLSGVNSSLIQAPISVLSARPNRVTAMIAEKMSNKIIVVAFGGKSTKKWNAQMIKLAELGFRGLDN